MLDNKILFSFAIAITMYAILYKTTCKDKESYYDQNSLLYASLMGAVVFLGMRSMETAAPVGGKHMVNENVMTAPFSQ